MGGFFFFFYLWACAKHGRGGRVEGGLKGQGATEEGDRRCLAGGRWIPVTSTFLFIYLERAPQPARESAPPTPPPHTRTQLCARTTKACVQGVICVLNMQSKGADMVEEGGDGGGGGSSELTPDLPASTRSDGLRFSQNTTSSPSRFVCFHT